MERILASLDYDSLVNATIFFMTYQALYISTIHRLYFLTFREKLMSRHFGEKFYNKSKLQSWILDCIFACRYYFIYLYYRVCIVICLSVCLSACLSVYPQLTLEWLKLDP